MKEKFRKKPVVIEAWKLDEETLYELIELEGFNHKSQYTTDNKFTGLSIVTLEGDMLANPGDWIIKGINGEFYPCKPDIFEKTYDKVNE